jgi:hypothetical protein
MTLPLLVLVLANLAICASFAARRTTATTTASHLQMMAKKPVVNYNKRGVSGGNDVEKYLKMKEITRLKNLGASYEEIKNGTVEEKFRLTSSTGTSDPAGYQKLLKSQRGPKQVSLEARLHAVVAYKRSTAGDNAPSSDGLTARENEELDEMMESTEGDEDEEEDDSVSNAQFISQCVLPPSHFLVVWRFELGALEVRN